ncbi:MAG: FliH/SctL family protein [Candidatus Korobacteraceae bacterium]
MSTSSERWGEMAFPNRVKNFHYPVMPPPMFRPAAGADGGSDEAGRKARETAMQHELAAVVETAREQGVRQGEAQARTTAERAVDEARQAVSSALKEFEQQRADYFRRVESEVVRLALAIARKVLHREAQLDPLLLAGVVRVALDQMQAGTRVVLRTSTEAAETWRKFCDGHCRERQSVEVIGDSSLAGPGCVLQAEVGSTEISLEGQLQEIQRGFFDLLGERPGDEP